MSEFDLTFSMVFGRIASTLGSDADTLGARDLAELLWLLPRVSLDLRRGHLAEAARGAVVDARTPGEASEGAVPDGNVFPKGTALRFARQGLGESGATAGRVFNASLGQLEALDRPLRIARALSALSPEVEIPGVRRMDVHASVKATAASRGARSIVFSGRLARETNLLVLLDLAGQMVPWRASVKKLLSLADQSGGFPTQTVLGFDSTSPAKVTFWRLDRDLGAGSQALLRDGLRQGSRQLIILISDGLGAAIGSGALGVELARVPAEVGIIWVHPWPESSWERSGLAKLARKPSVLGGQSRRAELRIPVVGLSPQGLERVGLWLQGVSAKGLWTATLPKTLASTPYPPASSGREIDWETRLRRLSAIVEPETLQLIGLASAIPGNVDLELLYAIGRRYGGANVGRHHLAELLATGALERLAGQTEASLVLGFRSDAVRRAAISYLERKRIREVLEYLRQRAEVPGERERARRLSILIETLGAEGVHETTGEAPSLVEWLRAAERGEIDSVQLRGPPASSDGRSSRGTQKSGDDGAPTLVPLRLAILGENGVGKTRFLSALFPVVGGDGPNGNWTLSIPAIPITFLESTVAAWRRRAAELQVDEQPHAIILVVGEAGRGAGRASDEAINEIAKLGLPFVVVANLGAADARRMNEFRARAMTAAGSDAVAVVNYQVPVVVPPPIGSANLTTTMDYAPGLAFLAQSDSADNVHEAILELLGRGERRTYERFLELIRWVRGRAAAAAQEIAGRAPVLGRFPEFVHDPSPMLLGTGLAIARRGNVAGEALSRWTNDLWFSWYSQFVNRLASGKKVNAGKKGLSRELILERARSAGIPVSIAQIAAGISGRAQPISLAEAWLAPLTAENVDRDFLDHVGRALQADSRVEDDLRRLQSLRNARAHLVGDRGEVREEDWKASIRLWIAIVTRTRAAEAPEPSRKPKQPWTGTASLDSLAKGVRLAASGKYPLGLSQRKEGSEIRLGIQSGWGVRPRQTAGRAEFFMEQAADVRSVKAGLIIQKGLMRLNPHAVEVDETLFMEPYWAWYALVQDLKGGAVRKALELIVKGADLVPEITLEIGVPHLLEGGAIGLAAIERVRFDYYEGGSIGLTELTGASSKSRLQGAAKLSRLHALGRFLEQLTDVEPERWASLSIGIPVRRMADPPADAGAPWNGKDFWRRAMEPLSAWVR